MAWYGVDKSVDVFSPPIFPARFALEISVEILARVTLPDYSFGVQEVPNSNLGGPTSFFV